MLFYDFVEDFSYGGVIKCGDVDGVEVVQEVRCYGIVVIFGRFYGIYYLNIYQMDGRSVFKVIFEGILKKKEKLNKLC